MDVKLPSGQEMWKSEFNIQELNPTSLCSARRPLWQHRPTTTTRLRSSTSNHSMSLSSGLGTLQHLRTQHRRVEDAWGFAEQYIRAYFDVNGLWLPYGHLLWSADTGAICYIIHQHHMVANGGSNTSDCLTQALDLEDHLSERIIATESGDEWNSGFKSASISA